MSTKTALNNAKQLWSKIPAAVCFDVDSTVVSEEGIDVLAEHCGAGAEVAAWTAKAMGGSVPFHEALEARLNLMKPNRPRRQQRAKIRLVGSEIPICVNPQMQSRAVCKAPSWERCRQASASAEGQAVSSV